MLSHSKGSLEVDAEAVVVKDTAQDAGSFLSSALIDLVGKDLTIGNMTSSALVQVAGNTRK